MPDELPPSPPKKDLAALYRATLSPLRRYLARMLRNPSDAQDLAHDAYQRVYEAMDTPQVGKPEAFLFTTARRLALNQIRRKQTAPVRGAGPNVVELIPAALVRLAEATKRVRTGADGTFLRRDVLADTLALLVQAEGFAVASSPAIWRTRTPAASRRSPSGGGGKLAWSGSYAFARAEETLHDGVTIARTRHQRHTAYRRHLHAEPALAVQPRVAVSHEVARHGEAFFPRLARGRRHGGGEHGDRAPAWRGAPQRRHAVSAAAERRERVGFLARRRAARGISVARGFSFSYHLPLPA